MLRLTQRRLSQFVAFLKTVAHESEVNLFIRFHILQKVNVLKQDHSNIKIFQFFTTCRFPPSQTVQVLFILRSGEILRVASLIK